MPVPSGERKTSKNTGGSTPQDFFDNLDKEFHFTLDPCSTHLNAKCENHFTLEEDGLKQSWKGHTVFMNPPYGRVTTEKWIRKAFEESRQPNTVVVALLPSRTSNGWFHDYIWPDIAEIRFVRGRLKFSGAKTGAMFPSLVAIWRPNNDCGIW